MKAPAQLLIAVAITLAPGGALAAPTKAECVTANAAAQDQRRDGHFAAARAALITCLSPSCPALLQADCTKQMTSLEAAQPSIIFAAKDAAGNDLSAVRVSVDGTALATVLDGKPLLIDPGSHVFELESAGVGRVTKTLVIREGDAGRRETISLGEAPPGRAAPPPLLAPPPAPAQGHGLGTMRTAGLVVGGVGAAGLIVGGVFGGLMLSEISTQKRDCVAGACPNPAAGSSAHSSAETFAAVASAGFIAGGALVVTGATLFLTAKRPSEGPTVSLLPVLTPAAGGLALRGTF